MCVYSQCVCVCACDTWHVVPYNIYISSTRSMEDTELILIALEQESSGEEATHEADPGPPGWDPEAMLEQWEDAQSAEDSASKEIDNDKRPEPRGRPPTRTDTRNIKRRKSYANNKGKKKRGGLQCQRGLTTGGVN